MTDEKFISLLNESESSILDFKSDLYDLSNNSDDSALSKFVKDVISFTNTIREGSAYIIFGVKQNLDNTKEKNGISKNIDDGILQDKIKNKLYPLPKFKYFTKIYGDKTFGILEFPVRKYEFPITSTVKLKGIEVGKVYYRQGSTNTEALSLEVIRINTWLQSLPEVDAGNSTQTYISAFLKRLLTKTENLSEILPDIYSFAVNNNLEEIKGFCESEIRGFDVTNPQVLAEINSDPERYRYRVQTIKVSLDKIVQINLPNPEQVKRELDNSKGYYDIPYFFKDSISWIESHLGITNSMATITMRTKDVLPDYKNDYPLYGYIFNSNFTSLYQNIRQKLIDLVMNFK